MDTLMVETPTGTQLKIEPDRQFEGQPGDSVLRVTGEQNGSSVFDSTYVECSPQEAYLVSWLLRGIRQPAPELLEKISQEIQSVFPAKMTGRDAKQAAEIAWTGIRQKTYELLGVSEQHTPGGQGQDQSKIEQLAERFERASARGKHPLGQGFGDGQQYAGSHTGQQQQQQSGRQQQQGSRN